MKKFFAILLSAMLMLSLAVPAMAADDYSITIKNPNTAISINGNVYSAYKLFDLNHASDYSSYHYTIADSFKDFTYSVGEGESKTDYRGASLVEYVSKQSPNSDALNALAEAVLKYVDNANNQIAPNGTATANGETATIKLTDAGYYLVAGSAKSATDNNQTVVAACSLTTTNPVGEVTVKADMPAIDKVIDPDYDKTGDEVKYNNVAIGDTVQFKITSKVPNMLGYEKYFFVVNDTLSKGLTYNATSLTVKIGDKALTKDTDYTLMVSTDETSGETSLKIVFKNFIQYNNATYIGKDIIITYSATLNENAVIGVEGNPNKVNLTYSNNPNITPDGTDEPDNDDPKGVTPDSITYTYVTDLEIIKKDNTGKILTGAEFKLTGTKLNKVIVDNEVFTEDETGEYWKLKDGTFTKDAPTDANMDQSKYESIDIKYKKTGTSEVITVTEDVTAQAYVGEDGKLYFAGLSAGKYVITEMKAPDGYNILEEPIEVTIEWTAPAGSSTDCTWAYSGTDKETVNGNEVGTNHVTVINNIGSVLPETGGMGTTIFYIVGGIMVVGAVVLLVTKKRMSAEG